MDIFLGLQRLHRLTRWSSVTAAPQLHHRSPLACLAQSLESVTSSPSTLYVNCAAGSHGDGSARHPYWRITDALTLHGAGVMEYVGDFPVGARAGTATKPTVDTEHNGVYPTTTIYVGPTTDGVGLTARSSKVS